MIKTRLLTDIEEDELYGNRVIKSGKCYSENKHFYMQRNDDVLHINDDIINCLHPGFLNEKDDFREISLFEFKLQMKKVLYELDIFEFWEKIN